MKPAGSKSSPSATSSPCAKSDRCAASALPTSSPSALTAEYAKLGKRLLARLAEAGMHAERRNDQIVLLRAGSSVSLASGMPTGVLSELLHSGSVICQSRHGRSIFTISDAGRARILRDKAERHTASESEVFAAQHRQIEVREVECEGVRQTVRVNTKEEPLDVFRRGRHIAHLVARAELEAGERLQRDLVLAQAVPQVTANWSRLVVDGAGYHPGLNMPETILEARRRVDAAMRAVGPDFSGILMDVLGFAKGLETLEREHALPLRSGKVVLGYALRQLARHYGLSNAATGKDISVIRHWGAEDFRPRLSAG